MWKELTNTERPPSLGLSFLLVTFILIFGSIELIVILWCSCEVTGFLFHSPQNVVFKKNTSGVNCECPTSDIIFWKCLVGLEMAGWTRSFWVTEESRCPYFCLQGCLSVTLPPILISFSNLDLDANSWLSLVWGNPWLEGWRQPPGMLLRICIRLSVGKRAIGHTVGPEPSKKSPQSGFEGEGMRSGEEKSAKSWSWCRVTVRLGKANERQWGDLRMALRGWGPAHSHQSPGLGFVLSIPLDIS